MDRKLDVRKIYESVKERVTFKPEAALVLGSGWETLQRRWRSQRSWIIRTFRVSQCLRFRGIRAVLSSAMWRTYPW
mgnify:CR=1 FL=1